MHVLHMFYGLFWPFSLGNAAFLCSERGVAGELAGADASLGGDAESARGLHPDLEGERGASLEMWLDSRPRRLG